MFREYIAADEGQGLLSTKRYMKVLNSLPNLEIRKELFEKWKRDESLSGIERWDDIVEKTTARAGSKRLKDADLLEAWRVELVFAHCYPRLDANVSKMQNHLLKSPFCIHPKTGRVCVPIDPALAEAFNPFTVPTARSLCAEIDAFDRIKVDAAGDDANGARRSTGVKDTDKTALKAAIQTFRKVFLDDLLREAGKKQRESADRDAAQGLDF
jgi:DNA primase small subunit